MLPHIILFLRHGGDFVGGEFDVVHESLLGFVAADVHHLDNVIFVVQIHISASGASGSTSASSSDLCQFNSTQQKWL